VITTLTPEAIRTRFPEFVDRSDGEIAGAIETATELAVTPPSSTPWAAAHLLAIAEQATGVADGGSGEVKSEGLAGASMGTMPMAMSGDEVFWSTSAYGRMVLTLRRASPAVILGRPVSGWSR